MLFLKCAINLNLHITFYCSKDEMYKESLRQRSTAVSKTGSYHSEDSAIKVDSTPPRQRQVNAYEHDGRMRRSGSPEPAYSNGATGVGRPSHLRPLEREPFTDDSQVDVEKKKKKKKKHK